MEIMRASEVEIDELVEAFNQAYSDYYIPLKSTREDLEAHIRSNDISLADSFVAFYGKILGFSMSGIRGSEGWVGGMGVVPGSRGKGIGKTLLEKQLDNYGEIGVKTVHLEVITQNDRAKALYEKAGVMDAPFVEIRSFRL